MSATAAKLEPDGVALKIGPLRTREMPTQARAVERVRVILLATARLLCERAPEELSTTAIADSANIPVSSIYRYFPALDDILQELYFQASSEIRTELFAALSNIAQFPAWRERLFEALKVLRDYIAQHPYYRPLLILFLTHRGPVAGEDEEHNELVEFLAGRWSKGLDGFNGGDAQLVANTVVQIAISMEDLIAAQTDSKLADLYFEEMNRVLGNYLTDYLND